ncbi:MAG: pantoate--beta-alanine ligase [bacterium]|nr:pantoate--beta-alanine ligase [bacterium]
MDASGSFLVIRTVREMHREADRLREAGLRIGLVPTMGYLHEGHLSLVRQARRAADRVVVSIFVNPIQFGPKEDFATYPRNFERDLDLVHGAGADLVYAPEAGEMYPEGYATYVDVERLTDHLCGATRPGHFKGVATVVTKLFTAVKPHVAIFGQKDAQQVGVIRRMTRDLNLDVEVHTSPTVREADGLAKSSRNVYLDSEERWHAPVLFQALQEARAQVQRGERRAGVVLAAMERLIQKKPGTEVDYVSVVDAEDLQPVPVLAGRVIFALAVRFQKARLIDNMVLSIPADRAS